MRMGHAMSDATIEIRAGEIEAARQAAWEERGDFATPAARRRGSARSTSSPRARSPRATCTWATSATTRSATPTPASAAPAATPSCFGFGFDAFGLPAEMAAIEREVPPADWVESCGERMLEQMQRLGFSFDYERVFYSSDEGQYRWSQWLFVTLLEAGLIYRDDATVDWCDTCQTTLAALQVEDGRCWRCHNEVRLIRRPTWFLRITPYLEENDAQPAS